MFESVDVFWELVVGAINLWSHTLIGKEGVGLWSPGFGFDPGSGLEVVISFVTPVEIYSE